MAAVNQSYVQLARSLHPRVLKFLSRHPPEIASASSGQTNSTSSPSSSPSSGASGVSGHTPQGPAALRPCQNNPFLPKKSSVSGGWLEPTYSLRQQADIYKLASRQGVAELLPYTSKSLAERSRKREEFGLRVKGTGVGQSVKGHVSERYLRERLEKRKTAMKRMGGLIRFWRLRHRSRGWRNWPKAGR